MTSKYMVWITPWNVTEGEWFVAISKYANIKGKVGKVFSKKLPFDIRKIFAHLPILGYEMGSFSIFGYPGVRQDFPDGEKWVITLPKEMVDRLIPYIKE